MVIAIDIGELHRHDWFNDGDRHRQTLAIQGNRTVGTVMPEMVFGSSSCDGTLRCARDEAMQAESRSGLAMFGDRFPA